MTTYIDKKHRVKKVGDWWVPQWKRSWFFWGYWNRYKLMICEFAAGCFEMYSESWRDVMFDTEEHAVKFVRSAIERGYKGKFYVNFDETYPEGLKDR